MARVQETEVERDPEGNVVGYKQQIVRRKSGGFGWGLLFGILIVTLGIVGFAYNQGSFTTAGREADHATAQASQTLDQTADRAQQAANDAKSDMSGNNTASN